VKRKWSKIEMKKGEKDENAVRLYVII